MKFLFSAAAIALALPTLNAPAYAQEAEAVQSDPQRLQAARTMVYYLMPDGAYARMMEKSMDQIVAMSMDSVMDLPLRDLASAGRLSEAELAKAGPGTMRQMMAILDPHFEERQTLSMRTMMSGMTEVMTTMEPAMREGLSEAYAKRFTVAEMEEITTFFQSPTGARYAASAMEIYTDPAIMAKMQEMIPALMQEMPDIIAATQAATAHLPPARDFEDLSDEERAELDRIMGEVAE